jgi:hypothetical protein
MKIKISKYNLKIKTSLKITAYIKMRKKSIRGL